MKIIIPNADFSAISIGTTTVPYVPITEMLAYSNAIPSTFASWTDTQKKAVNKYFKILKANGLLGGTKITKLVLPKIGRVDGGVNLISPSENIGFPTSGATYTNNGVQFSAGWASGWSISNANNSSFGFYNTDGRPTAEGDVLSIGMAVSSSTLWLGRRIQSVERAGLLVNSSLTLRAVVTNRSYSEGLVQSRVTSSSQAVMVDGEYVSVTQDYTDSSSKNIIFSSHTNASTIGLFNAHIGMYYLSATALTESEMAIINSATTTLMGVI